MASCDDWRDAVQQLQEHQEALLDCLDATGVLSTERFRAQLHRRRFDSARRVHPCTFDATLSDMLDPPGAALPTAVFAGMTGARALSATSRAHRQAVGAIRGKLRHACMKLYVCGGYDGQQSLSSSETYSFATGKWEELPVMLQPRYGAAMASLSGCLYVCGGHDGQVALGSMERFDPDTRAWEALSASEQPRSRAVAAVVARQLYVCGGHDGHETLSSAERYDPETGVWEALPPMAQRRRSAGAAVIDGKLYVCGGLDNEAPLRSMERFDPASNAWEALPPIAQPRYGAATAALAGRIYICGNIQIGSHVGFDSRSAERFDPALGEWEDLPPMKVQRGAAAVAAVFGHLYVCGGYDGQQPLSSVDRFDPETEEWQSLPPMKQRRALAIGVVLAR